MALLTLLPPRLLLLPRSIHCINWLIASSFKRALKKPLHLPEDFDVDLLKGSSLASLDLWSLPFRGANIADGGRA